MKEMIEFTLNEDDVAELRRMIATDLNRLMDMVAGKLKEMGVDDANAARMFMSDLVMTYVSMLLKYYIKIINLAVLVASKMEDET